MSLPGKVLAGLNVLAALAFLYFGVTDWSRRQEWAYSVYRFELALDGLPLDESEADLEGTGRVGKLSDATVKQLLPSYAAAGKTQVAQVKDIHQVFRKEIDDADEGTKRSKLTNMLLPLARTLDEREALKQTIDNQPIDALMADSGPFESAFAQALATSSGQGQESGPEKQRRAIAHLLFNLSREDSYRQRVAAVIGLRAYTDESNQQAFALRQMADRLTVVLTRERGEFETENKRIVGELQLLTRSSDEKKSQLQREKDLVEQHRALVRARTEDVRAIKDEIEAARKDAQASLSSLDQEQKLLFAAQQRVGKSIEGNQKLEREIQGLEKTKR
jgi:hypothetical protein